VESLRYLWNKFQEVNTNVNNAMLQTTAVCLLVCCSVSSSFVLSAMCLSGLDRLSFLAHASPSDGNSLSRQMTPPVTLVLRWISCIIVTGDLFSS
jgi:hypothetical protein